MLAGYAIVVVADHGAGLLKVFSGDMMAMGSPGHFNLDFMFLLPLSAHWTRRWAVKKLVNPRSCIRSQSARWRPITLASDGYGPPFMLAGKVARERPRLIL
jgi:hypothetical protein